MLAGDTDWFVIIDGYVENFDDVLMVGPDLITANVLDRGSF